KESTNFPYWFKIINLLGQDEGRYSPVIVVLNEKDQQFAHKFNFDRSAIERQYPHVPLKVCEVNLSKRDHKFAALEQTIQEALANLPLVKAVKPAAWQPIREALREKAQTCDYINFKEYVAICEAHGVTEERQQLLFSRYLHRLGSLLHFENDSNLVDFIILNPQWAVDAVYAVITDNRIEQNKGYFTRGQVEAIWLNKKNEKGKSLYSKNERASLFSLMQKENFEICYPLNNRPNEFIAPQLLSPERPTLVTPKHADYGWDDKQNLKFRYQYTFMPEGIIARLIVRLSDLIKQHNSCDVVWRQGMLLEDKAKQCNALIQEAETAGLKVIDIAINGNAHQRKYLLYDIRTALNELHKRWFSNIQVEAMIPCNCRECSAKPNEGFYFKFSALKTAQEKGKSVKECDKSCIDVPILSLLEGIYKPEEIRFMSKEKEKDKENPAPSITNHFYGGVGQVGQGTTVNQTQYNQSPQINIEQRQQLSELIKALRNMDLSDDDMDVVDAARQVLRADEKQTTPETQGKLAKIWNGLKEFMDVSNNTIGVTTAAAPLVIEVLKATVL
ncbi:MAG TPA: COR domain-containing protein, partial [Thiolinea sp.]|nr:COR domain-containing protein [Thiolinea sp.]